MSLAAATCRVSYTGNGSTATYAYTFRIQDQGDLRAIVTDSDGVETALSIGTHYTVTGVGSASGNLVLVNGAFDWLDGGGDLDTGYSLTILRVVDLTQETDIRNQGAYYPETIEDALDHGVMISQQQQDEIDRSFKLPESLTSADFDPTLPADITTADCLIATNPSGDGLVMGPTLLDLAAVTADAAAAAASATAAATSATNSATSATASAASATSAASSATSATSSASSATSSASSATSSASAAATSATSAASSATAAAASATTAAGYAATMAAHEADTTNIHGIADTAALALTANSLQKSGGTFTLTGEVNFGATYGLTAEHFASRTANTATSGAFRLAQNDVVMWLNDTHDSNMDLGMDTSERLTWNGYPFIADTGHLANKLTDGKIYVGDASNDISEVTMTGDGNLSNTGVFSIGTGVIVDADINASAAIATSKLAAVTASRVLVSNASGFMTVSSITSTQLGYLGTAYPVDSATLVNNATTNINAEGIGNYNYFQYFYVIKRGAGNMETGIVTAIHDGTNVAYSVGNVCSLGTVGVTLDVVISGGTDVVFRGTTTNTGTAASLTYRCLRGLRS